MKHIKNGRKGRSNRDKIMVNRFPILATRNCKINDQGTWKQTRMLDKLTTRMSDKLVQRNVFSNQSTCTNLLHQQHRFSEPSYTTIQISSVPGQEAKETLLQCHIRHYTSEEATNQTIVLRSQTQHSTARNHEITSEDVVQGQLLEEDVKLSQKWRG